MWANCGSQSDNTTSGKEKTGQAYTKRLMIDSRNQAAEHNWSWDRNTSSYPHDVPTSGQNTTLSNHVEPLLYFKIVQIRDAETRINGWIDNQTAAMIVLQFSVSWQNLQFTLSLNNRDSELLAIETHTHSKNFECTDRFWTEIKIRISYFSVRIIPKNNQQWFRF